MGRFRWIDARKGILEYTRDDVPAAVEGVYIVDFTAMTVKGSFAVHDHYISMWSRSREARKAIFRDTDLCAMSNDDIPEPFVHYEDQAKMTEHYQSWLSRVMLAEDIHKSRAEERKGSSQAVHGSTSDGSDSSQRSERDQQVEQNSSRGGDRDDGRSNMRSHAQNFPVVPGEHAWRIRRK